METHFRRQQALGQGASRGHLDHLVASKQIVPVRRGLYVPASANDPCSRAFLAAQLDALGPTAYVSHFSAAALHGFDSTLQRPLQAFLTVDRSSGVRSDQRVRVAHASRSRTTHVVDGLLVTSRAETVVDLAAIVSRTELGRILESALRGPDPRRPHVWRTEVLDELHEMLGGDRRRKGLSRVARALADRFSHDGVANRTDPPRPTGSFPETVLLQAMNEAGIGVIRQPRVVSIDSEGRRFGYFPDFLIVTGRCLIEVDGTQHEEKSRVRSDRVRANRLVGFHLLRYAATTVLSDTARVVNDIAEHVQSRQVEWTWETGGRLVAGSGDEWTVSPAPA
jgi:very-short-patch-repair endonuclease